ncbi:MAG TPA: hydantoinase B/oxoprolinase family protein [Rhizomicrobium sp.]
MDKVTYEIVRSGLYSIAREMKIAMMRTAASPIIHSGGDASAAIFDSEMQLVAQGNDIPTMLGSAVLSVKASVEAVGRGELRPGDVIVSNDAYLGGGNHQPDVQLTRPIFLNGEIVAFAMTRGHWSDIGGQSPGSFDPDTWDIFGEGMRIPPVLLYRNDTLVKDTTTLIVQNMRDPQSRMLDIKAQYAGVFLGEQRIVGMARRYGADALRESMGEALDQSERLMRAQIGRMPDGVYEAEDFIEPVGEGDLIPVRVKITIRGDGMIVDFTGSAPQVRGGINCPLAVTCNSTWYTIKAVTDKAIPINQGCYRPIEIVCPAGSILNCEFPASVVSGNTETSPRVIDMLLGALAKALPDRVIAQSHSAASVVTFSGDDPDAVRGRALGRRYVSMIDVHAGGMGARPRQDGVSAVRVHVGNTATQPVEQIEKLTPLVIEEWSLVQDSGGAGRYRGGLTTRRVYRMAYEEATCSVIGERSRVAPRGILGGEAGATFRAVLSFADGRSRTLPSKGRKTVLAKGDRLSIAPAGSGGCGDPHLREPNRVLDDVIDGYVSRDAARERYGVVLLADGQAVDEPATAKLRTDAGRERSS